MKQNILGLFFLGVAFLSAEILPDWVLNIPENTGEKYAVGFSGVFRDSLLAERNAFICGCYFLSMQDEVTVRSMLSDNSTKKEADYYLIVKVDSLVQHYYEEHSQIVAKYCDDRYCYVLVSTGTKTINTKLIEYNAKNIPILRNEKGNEFVGYGIVNRKKAEGFLHSTWQAYQNLAGQLQTDIKHYFKDGKDSVYLTASKIEITISNTRITGYYVNDKGNMITCFISYNSK